MPPQNDYEQYPWLKFWSRDWLQGSLRYENTPAERGFFADMLALANECRGRREPIPLGCICANPTTPLSHAEIARKLVIDLDEFEAMLAKMKAQGRITEDGNGFVTVVNFQYYQERGKRKRRETAEQPVLPDNPRKREKPPWKVRR